MGRQKIAIKKLESSSERKATFLKRSKGIENKVKELSQLCDTQVLLIMQSPRDEGQYKLCLGENCNLYDILKLYLEQTPESHQAAYIRC